jgi:hypothetical protein
MAFTISSLQYILLESLSYLPAFASVSIFKLFRGYYAGSANIPFEAFSVPGIGRSRCVSILGDVS